MWELFLFWRHFGIRIAVLAVLKVMTPYERCLRSMAELAREQEESLKGEEYVLARLRWEDWPLFRRLGLGFARQELRKRKWRGRRGGVLPGGCDAEDIVDQVIAEILQGKGRLVPGWTWQKVQREVERLVSQRIRVMHRLREAAVMRSEWEFDEDGRSVLEGIVDENGNGVEAAEGREEVERRIKSVEEHLGGDGKLVELFRCWLDGVKGSAEIAQRLGVGEAEVSRLRKRLERKLEKLKGGGKGLATT